MIKQDDKIVVLPTKDQITSFIYEYEKEPSHRNNEVIKQLAELVKSLPFLKKAQTQKGSSFIISTLNRMKLEKLRKGDELYSKNDLNKNQFYILLSGQAIMRIETNNKLILQGRNTNSSLQQMKQSCLRNDNCCVESSQNMLNIEIRPKASSIIKQGDYLIKQRAKLLLPSKINKDIDKENIYLDTRSNDIKQEVEIQQRVISGLATIGESSHISRDGGFDVLGIEIKSTSAVVLKLAKDIFEELFSDIVQSEEVCRKQQMFEQIPLFRKFNESELKSVMKKTNIVSYKKGQVAFKETDKADRCFIVKKGEFVVEKEIKVVKNVLMPDIFKQKTAKRALICSFTQGQLFGLEEMFLSSQNSLNCFEGVRMNSVKCLTQEGELFEIPYIVLSQFLDNGRLDFELKNWQTKSQFRNDILSKQIQNIDAQQLTILSIRNALKSGEQHKQKQLPQSLQNKQSQKKLESDQTQVYLCNSQSYSSTIPYETFLTKFPEDYRSENFERCQQRQRSNTEFVFGSNKTLQLNSINGKNSQDNLKQLLRQPSASLSSNVRSGSEITEKRKKWISQLSGNIHRSFTSDNNQYKPLQSFSQPSAYLSNEGTLKEQDDSPFQQLDKLNTLQIEINTNSTDSSGFGYIPERISQRCPKGIKEVSNSLEESQELKALQTKGFTYQNCGPHPLRKLDQMNTLQTITSDSLSYSLTKTRSLTMTSNQHSKYRDNSNNTTHFKITTQEENLPKLPIPRQSLLKLLQHNQSINTKYFSPDFSTLQEEEDQQNQHRKQQLRILPSLAVKNTKRLMKKSRRLSQERLLQGLNKISNVTRSREPSFQMKKLIQRQQFQTVV